MYATDKVYHDSRPEEIESLPDTAFHRNVDLAIIDADNQGAFVSIRNLPLLASRATTDYLNLYSVGYLRALIVSPPLIFGMASGPLFEDGLSNRHSIQLPLLIKTSLARGQVGMVGANNGKISAAEAPFGGIKESGYGKEGSLYGLREYQITKSITIGNIDSTV